MLSLTNNWLISRRNPAGWLGNMLFQVLATPFDVLTRQYGFLLLTVPALIVAVNGYRRFRRDAPHDLVGINPPP